MPFFRSAYTRCKNGIKKVFRVKRKDENVNSVAVSASGASTTNASDSDTGSSNSSSSSGIENIGTRSVSSSSSSSSSSSGGGSSSSSSSSSASTRSNSKSNGSSASGGSSSSSTASSSSSGENGSSSSSSSSISSSSASSDGASSSSSSSTSLSESASGNSDAGNGNSSGSSSSSRSKGKPIKNVKTSKKAVTSGDGDPQPKDKKAVAVDTSGSTSHWRLYLDSINAVLGPATKKAEEPPAKKVDMSGSRRLSLDGDILKRFSTAKKGEKFPVSPAVLDSSPVTVNSDIFEKNSPADPNDANDGTEKFIRVENEEIQLPIHLGAASSAGWSSNPGKNKDEIGVRKANQDSYCVIAPYGDDSKNAFMSVFDGHGAEGRVVSQLVRDSISKSLLENFKSSGPMECDLSTESFTRRFAAFKKAFGIAENDLKREESEINHAFSGTTAVCVWLVGQVVYAAWSGDSRAIVGRTNGSTTQAIELTYDQKPLRSDEKKRVRAAGGRVTRWQKNLGPLRVWLPDDWIPGLAMTRSIGDTILTPHGVIPEPELTVTELSPKDSFIVLASDGVWEFMSSGEVATFIAKQRKSKATPTEAARKLVAEAVKRWKKNETVTDDTTVIVVWLDYKDNGTAELSTPHQVLESGDLTPFAPHNDAEKPVA